MSYDMVYSIFIKSVCVVVENEGVFGFRPLCRSLYSISEPLLIKEHALSAIRMPRAVI